MASIFIGALWLAWIYLVGFIFFSIRDFINRKKNGKTSPPGTL